jgi:hypothetical protein
MISGINRASANAFSISFFEKPHRCRGRFRNSEDVVNRDNADQHPQGVGDWQRGAVFFLKHGDRSFLIVRGFERNKLMIHQVRHGVLRRSQEQRTDMNVINHHTLLIYYLH